MDKKISLKNGLMAGGSLVLYFLLFYFLDKASMLKIWVAAFSILIYVVFMASAVAEQREKQEDIISFKEAISVAFLTFIIANVVYYIFYFIIIKTDPELLTLLKQKYIDIYKKILADRNPADIEKNFQDFKFNFSTIALWFARDAIGGFILSAISAAIMRRGKRVNGNF